MLRLAIESIAMLFGALIAGAAVTSTVALLVFTAGGHGPDLIRSVSALIG